MLKADEYNEHCQKIKKAIMDQKILLNGETLDMYDNNENFLSSDKNDFPKP